jgi:hypothetical protein
MRFAVALAVVALLAPAAFAYNSVETPTTEPYVEVHGGVADMTIVVYTDDCYGYDYVLDALNQLGYGYTLYYMDYSGFEAAVASGMYDLIIVNHECYFELSYAWDDIYYQLLAGKCAILNSFDWDASNDYSGFCWSVLGLAGHEWYMDVQYAYSVYVWNFTPIYDGTDGVLDPVIPDYYIDEGDYLAGTGESGWTTSPDYYSVNCNIYCGDYALVIISWCMDEYDFIEVVQVWKNAINWIYWGASATDATSWGGVKAMYK